MEKVYLSKAFISEARERIQNLEFQEAILRLNQSVSLVPNIEAKYMISLCYFNMKNYVVAIQTAKETEKFGLENKNDVKNLNYVEKSVLIAVKSYERLGDLLSASIKLNEIPFEDNCRFQEDRNRLQSAINSTDEYKSFLCLLQNYTEYPGNKSYIISKS